MSGSIISIIIFTIIIVCKSRVRRPIGQMGLTSLSVTKEGMELLWQKIICMILTLGSNKSVFVAFLSVSFEISYHTFGC